MESVPGDTRFIVRLPLEDGPAAAEAPQQKEGT
jgi:hypothetical protein